MTKRDWTHELIWCTFGGFWIYLVKSALNLPWWSPSVLAVLFASVWTWHEVRQKGTT